MSYSLKGGLYRALCVLAASLLLGTQPSAAQPESSCDQRPRYLPQPWVDGVYFCLERVTGSLESGDALDYAALAVDESGTLYAARPDTGEIVRFVDQDGDALPDTPQTIASGLDQPRGLTWQAGALYILGGTQLYRLREGQIETLRADLPAGSGSWSGGLALDAEGAVYVAIGAPCLGCGEAEGRGAVLRYPPDLNGPPDVIASGLHAPGDLTLWEGALWTNDSAPFGIDPAASADSIYRVTPGEAFDLPERAAAALPADSRPLGMAPYRGERFPQLDGALLVALNGSRNQSQTSGYEVRALWFDADGRLERDYRLIPNAGANTVTGQYSLNFINILGTGFFPRRPLDIAVTADGVIYISTTGGWIMALR